MYLGMQNIIDISQNQLDKSTNKLETPIIERINKSVTHRNFKFVNSQASNKLTRSTFVLNTILEERKLNGKSLRATITPSPNNKTEDQIPFNIDTSMMSPLESGLNKLKKEYFKVALTIEALQADVELAPIKIES